jgi:hypothetical protein
VCLLNSSSLWLPVHVSPQFWSEKHISTYRALLEGTGAMAEGLEPRDSLESSPEQASLQQCLGGDSLVYWIKVWSLESDMPGFVPTNFWNIGYPDMLQPCHLYNADDN